jgi:hypothetical protein
VEIIVINAGEEPFNDENVFQKRESTIDFFYEKNFSHQISSFLENESCNPESEVIFIMESLTRTSLDS